jgi:ABC-type amino acid transport substrate-binding protein
MDPKTCPEAPWLADRPGVSRRGLLMAAVAAGAAAGGVPATAAPLRLPIAISDVGTQRFPRAILAAVAEGEGIEWDIHAVPWPRIVAMAQRGETLAFGLSPTPRRQPVFAFSEPLYDSRVWALSHREQSPLIDSAEQLRGLAVCAGRGVSYGESIDSLLADSTQTSLVLGDVASRARLVLAQRCDVALFSSYAQSSDMLERKLQQRLPDARSVYVHRQPLATWSTHIAARRGHELAQGLERINRAIRRQHRAIRALAEAGR